MQPPLEAVFIFTLLFFKQLFMHCKALFVYDKIYKFIKHMVISGK